MNKQWSINFQEFESIIDLPLNIQNIFKHSFLAWEKAYAPYSQFNVGCAIGLENGQVVIGNNQENASYPVGICAERVGLSSAFSQFPDSRILQICIVAGKDKNNGQAIAPCGMCRQALLEYENRQNSPIEVYFMGTTGKIIKFDQAKDLMPFSFSGEYLI